MSIAHNVITSPLAFSPGLYLFEQERVAAYQEKAPFADCRKGARSKRGWRRGTRPRA